MAASADRPAVTNVLLLAVAQALLLTTVVGGMAISALAGQNLTPNPALATIPIAALVIGPFLASWPASSFMARYGRRAGFSLGAGLGVSGGAVAATGVAVADLRLFAFGLLNRRLPGLRQLLSVHGNGSRQRPLSRSSHVLRNCRRDRRRLCRPGAGPCCPAWSRSRPMPSPAWRSASIAAPPGPPTRRSVRPQPTFSASRWRRRRFTPSHRPGHRPALCFAHVTNQMAQSEGDFEKGEADGAVDALAVLAAAASAVLPCLNQAREGGEK